MIIIMIGNRSEECEPELCKTRERTIDVDKIEQGTIWMRKKRETIEHSH